MFIAYHVKIIQGHKSSIFGTGPYLAGYIIQFSEPNDMPEWCANDIMQSSIVNIVQLAVQQRTKSNVKPVFITAQIQFITAQW